MGTPATVCATYPVTGPCAAPEPTAAATLATTRSCTDTSAGITVETAAATGPHARPATTTLPAAVTATGAATPVAELNGNVPAPRINLDPASKDAWLISEAMLTQVRSPCGSD